MPPAVVAGASLLAAGNRVPRLRVFSFIARRRRFDPRRGGPGNVPHRRLRNPARQRCRYLEKAPLPYWLVATGFHLFGVNEFATRLPNVLAIFLLAWLAVRWGSRAFDDRTGI